MNKFFFLLFIPVSILCHGQNDQYLPVHKDGNWYFGNKSDTILKESMRFDTIHFCSSNYQTYFLAIQNDSLFNLYDFNLKSVLQGKQSDFLSCENNLLLKWKNDWTRYDFFKNKSNVFQADSLIKRKNIIYIMSQNKVGLIQGSLFIPANYKRVVPFNSPDGTAENFLILNGDKFGLINQAGKMIIQPEASIIQFEDHDIIKFKVGHWKYLCPDGKIVDPAGKEIHFYSSNDYKIYNPERTKSFFYKNHILLSKLNQYEDFFPLRYINLIAFSNFYIHEDSYMAVKKNGKMGVINSSQKQIIPPFCDQIEYMGGSFFKFLQGEKWGLIDANNVIKLEATYDNILEIIETKNGRQYKIAINGKVGIIDINAKPIIEAKYDNIDYQSEGYITMLDLRLGFFSSIGKEILPMKFDGYQTPDEFIDLRDLAKSNFLAFDNSHRFTFINNHGQKLNISECKDYQISNDVLKCYFDDRIEVYYFKDGQIDEKTVYPGIQRVNVEHHFRETTYVLHHYVRSYLELNQLTGLYGARNILKSGMALNPTYKHHLPTLFANWYEAGVIADTNVRIDLYSFPGLKAYSVFNWMNCSSAEFSKENVLSLEIFRKFYDWTESDDVFQLIEGENINWISRTNKDKLDYDITSEGLIYHEDLDLSYQKVLIGNKINFSPMYKADISLMDYFNYLNKGRNLWFSSPGMAELIMNPSIGINLENTQLGIRDKRTLPREEFKYEIDDFRHESYWNLYCFQKSGESTWNITNDLSFKSELIENVESYQIGQEIDKEYVIVDQKVKGGNSTKKAIYTTNLLKLSDPIYDDVIYAGAFGYLVRIGNQYSYLEFNY